MKEIYYIWTHLPLARKAARRGSHSKDRAKQKIDMHNKCRKEVKGFLATLGITQLPLS